MATKTGDSKLAVVTLVVKLVAMAAGVVGTLIGLMAIVGLFIQNGWVRAIAALVVAFGLPLLVADRLLPEDSTSPAAGVVTDVLALSWLGFTFLFAGVLHSVTKPMLLREGDRLTEAGWETLGSAAYLLGSAKALPGQAGTVPDPAGSAEASASAAASAGPTTSASAMGAVDAGAPPADAGAPREPSKGDKTPSELFKELAPSVVTIFVKGQGEGSGTGFLIDNDGTIATNHHVINGAGNVRIKFMNGAVFESVELLTDVAAVDLALLRVDLKTPADAGPPVTAQPLTLGDSEAVVVGERAISIGNPLGLEHTLTDGLISARRLYEGRAWIQMSVPVSPGNSGGPLFNMRGEVVGVTTQQVLGGFGGFGRAQNLNLAVPVNELKKLIQPTYPQRRKFGDGTSPSQW